MLKSFLFFLFAVLLIFGVGAGFVFLRIFWGFDTTLAVGIAFAAFLLIGLLIQIRLLRQRVTRLEASHLALLRAQQRAAGAQAARPDMEDGTCTGTESPHAQQAEPAHPASLPLDLEPTLQKTEQPVQPAPVFTQSQMPQEPIFSTEQRPDILAQFESSELFNRVKHFFTAGNVVLKIGLVVLFFGVAFLLKYAEQRNMLPIEVRLIGAALGGLALLLVGWNLRRRQPLYGLSLEGGGMGVLYLVVFASAKFYSFLPMPLALGIMVGLVAFSGLLAILQDGRGLAFSGAVGGFLAPILLSTGTGNHVTLFSYYALLNCGILGIAWFKAWRELNLLGFFFTFSVMALWGSKAYTPAFFNTSEPFLIGFFLMYCLISVLFATRQPLQLRGFIDGPLVFGLPMVASALQAGMVYNRPYGMALSALGLGMWYIGLARLMWNRFQETMHLLTEVFLALGVVFTSLAIPLAVDPQWTTAAWALEGAAMVWVGVRQNRAAARLFGILLQLGAALAVFSHPFAFAKAALFLNGSFLGFALVGIAGVFSSFWLEKLVEDKARFREPSWLPRLLLAWGLVWWYGGAMLDIQLHYNLSAPIATFLMFTCATTLVLALIAWYLRWQLLIIALLLLLPILLLQYGLCILHDVPALRQFTGLSWPLAILLQYALLYFFTDQWPERLRSPWHCLSFWFLLFFLMRESDWWLEFIPSLSEAWYLALAGIVVLIPLYLLEFYGDKLRWPVRQMSALYHGLLTDVPVAALLLWGFFSLRSPANAGPLPYIPVLNPLELVELGILLLALVRWLRKRTRWNSPYQPGLLGLLLFAWGNALVGRAVHTYAHIHYLPYSLFRAPVFQTSLAVFWGTLALCLTLWGARKKLRSLWLAGAGLLALVVIKLFFIDLAGTGSIGRIISFLAVGLLMLIIGYFAPLPPKSKEPTDAVS